MAGGAAADLYDAESVVFTLLINQGLLGFIGYIGLLLAVLRGVGRLLPTVSSRRMFTGLVLGYALFTVATGVMDTLQLFLLLSLFVGAYGRAFAASDATHHRTPDGQMVQAAAMPGSAMQDAGQLERGGV